LTFLQEFRRTQMQVGRAKCRGCSFVKEFDFDIERSLCHLLQQILFLARKEGSAIKPPGLCETEAISQRDRSLAFVYGSCLNESRYAVDRQITRDSKLRCPFFSFFSSKPSTKDVAKLGVRDFGGARFNLPRQDKVQELFSSFSRKGQLH